MHISSHCFIILSNSALRNLKKSSQSSTNFFDNFFLWLHNAELDKIMKQWDEMCINYRNNEENIEVVDETQFKIELEPSKNR